MNSSKKNIYKKRQEKVLELLKDEALLVFAQPEFLRNSTVEHDYRQDSTFYYLLGFSEPSAALLFTPYLEKKTHLFLREKNFLEELWTGRRLGVDEATHALAADQIYAWKDLTAKIPELLKGASGLRFNIGYHAPHDQIVISALDQARRLNLRKNVYRMPLRDPHEITGPLRLRKDADEVVILRRAAAATAAGYRRVFQETKPGMNERQIHGMLLGAFLENGGEMEAYGSIVAGGVNACILHYRSNNQELKDGDLLLIDAGSQVENYASDVTRTFPVGKKFSPVQRDLFDIVFDAQAQAIGQCHPGSNWQNVHNAAIDRLVVGLMDLKLLSGSKEEIIDKQTYKKFYGHGTSHWIGLDVHDQGPYSLSDGNPIPFESGMYFSVEPGLYIDPTYTDVPEEFRGIGIRIEDDVLITDSGHEVITAAIPKSRAFFESRS